MGRIAEIKPWKRDKALYCVFRMLRHPCVERDVWPYYHNDADNHLRRRFSRGAFAIAAYLDDVDKINSARAAFNMKAGRPCDDPAINVKAPLPAFRDEITRRSFIDVDPSKLLTALGEDAYATQWAIIHNAVVFHRDVSAARSILLPAKVLSLFDAAEKLPRAGLMPPPGLPACDPLDTPDSWAIAYRRVRKSAGDSTYVSKSYRMADFDDLRPDQSISDKRIKDLGGERELYALRNFLDRISRCCTIYARQNEIKKPAKGSITSLLPGVGIKDVPFGSQILTTCNLFDGGGGIRGDNVYAMRASAQRLRQLIDNQRTVLRGREKKANASQE